jgi:hypothetical protein
MRRFLGECFQLLGLGPHALWRVSRPNILAGTWGAYVVIGRLGQSELLLGSDLQECQGASQRQHDVRAQDSTCGDGSLRAPTGHWTFFWFNAMSAVTNTHTIPRKFYGLR